MTPRHPLRSLALAGLTVAALLTTAVPARAQDGAADAAVAAATTGSAALDGALGLLEPHLRDVPIRSAQLDRARGELLALEAAILEARATRLRAEADLRRLGAERDELRGTIAVQRARRLDAGTDISRVQAELAELAVASYVGGGTAGDPLPLDDRASTAAGRRRVLVGAVDDELRERLAAAEAELADATARVVTARDRLDDVVVATVATTATRDGAIRALARDEPRLPDAQLAVVAATRLAEVVGADFPLVAYDAYHRGARLVAAERPGCGLPWTVLAGIGRVESRHGSYGRSTLRGDGTTTRRIIGIALDGSEGVAAIGDTDGGRLDGDPVYDRAVGPMQFIPSTWRAFARDGDGDGVADPHNLYDAAASAAAYLCRSGNGLGGGAALDRAILSYNASRAYVTEVLRHRRAYDRLGLAG